MSSWKKYKLGEFAEINPRVPLKQGKEYSFVEMKDLDAMLKYVSPSAKKELKGGSKFANKDTLFARITPCLENGKICQVKNLENNLGFGSTEFLIFRGKENISDTDFVYYLTKSDYVKNNAIQMMTGTSGRQRVEKSALENLEITVPDLPTQSQIAQILTSFDDKIELLGQMNQTLETMAQTIFKEWFVDFNFPQMSESEFTGLKNEQNKNSENEKSCKSSNSENPDSDKLPKGWRMGKLGEILELLYGKALKADTRIFGKYPVIGSSGIVDYHNEYLVVSPGIVIGRKGTIGEVIWIDENFFPIDTTFYVKDLSGSNGLFFHYFLLKEQEFKKISSDSAVPGLNRNQAMDSIVIIPDINVVDMFNSIAKSIFEKMKENILQIRTLTQLRDSLLPKLMSGEVGVK
jgi:type I restriction enzyme S subunit